MSVSHINGVKIRSASPKRLDMPCRTTTNVVDCGVFLMRHMETYNGEHEGWECGLCNEADLENNQQHQLDKLRRKYATKISLHYLNDAKESFIKDTVPFMKLAKDKKMKIYRQADDRISKRMANHVD